MNPALFQLLFMAGIIIGLVGQHATTLLKRAEQHAAHHAFKVALIGFWLAFGAGFALTGMGQFTHGQLLSGVSAIALGVGLALSGIAQATEWAWLKWIGIVVIALASFATGVSQWLSGQLLTSLIALFMGVGVIAGTLRGPISGLSQMMVGAVMAASAAVLMAFEFVQRQQASALTLVLGGVMAIMGVVTLVSGVRGVVSSSRMNNSSVVVE